MRFLKIVILIFVINGCQSKQSEQKLKKQFDYNSISTNEFKADTNKKQLIYEILNRAFVEKKDVPGYNLIKNKKKIYICNLYLPNFEKRNKIHLNQSEIPSKINEVEFVIKSEKEIQNLANETNDFLYSTIKHLEINGKKAKIGLSNYWVMSQKNKGKYAFMSGGMYILNFKKINGRWTFDENAEHLFRIS
jgi:D-ribose pyranose/furanose isomerase RbsD